MSTTYTFELTDSSGKEKLTINLTKNLVVRSEWSVIDGNAGHNCLIVDNGVVDDKTVNRLICRSGLEPNIPIIILKHADWNAAVAKVSGTRNAMAVNRAAQANGSGSSSRKRNSVNHLRGCHSL